MEKTKLGYADFLAAVEDRDRAAVAALHQVFDGHGCKIEVKEAKSGYVVSYSLNKKTAVNFVFRKTGLLIRIYANHLQAYMPFLETLPAGMMNAVEKAPDCKRLINPDACNPKCAKGYDFLLHGKRFQKCRYNAFMFLLCEENNAFIKAFVENELKACI